MWMGFCGVLYYNLYAFYVWRDDIHLEELHMINIERGLLLIKRSGEELGESYCSYPNYSE